MNLQRLTRWLQRPAASQQPLHDDAADRPATAAAAADAAAQAASPGAPPPPPSPAQPGSPARSILQVDEQQLARDRESVAQQQHDAFGRIRRLQGDIQGVASRHAQARASGRPAEKVALVRVFASLKLQLAKAEQFHADLMNHRQLLDNLSATREFAALRQRLQQGVMAGVGFAGLRQLVDASLAAELHERTQTSELLHDWARHDEDAGLQNQAGYTDAEDQLNAMSEAEYQAQAQAQMQPLEAEAQRLEHGLQRMPASEPASQAAPLDLRAAATPTPPSPHPPRSL